MSSNIFDDFSEISTIDVESKMEAKNQDDDTVIRSEELKKMIMQMKKQKKSLKKLKKKIRKITKKISVDDGYSESKKDGSKDSPKEKSKNTTPQKEKTFWVKMGDAILKALPSVLRTAATVVAAIILGQAPKPHGIFRKAVA